MPTSRMLAVTAAAVALAAGTALLPGCKPRGGSDGASAGAKAGGPGSPGATGAPARAEPQTERERVQAGFDRLVKTIASSRPSEKVAQVKNFLAMARSLEAMEKGKFPEIARAEELLKRVQDELEIEARGAYAEVEEEVMKILNSPNPDHVQAEGLLDRRRRDLQVRFADSAIRKQLDELKQTILRYQEAEFDYRARMARIGVMGEEYVRIIGVLEGFSPELDSTPYGSKIRAEVDKYYGLYAASINEKKQQLEAIPSQKWKLNDYLIWSGPADFPEKYADGVLTLGPNPSSYDERDSQGLYVAFGDGTWIDVHITFEAQLKAPAGIRFGARGHEDPFRRRYTFTPLSLEEMQLPEGSDEWQTFVIKIEGVSFEVSATTAKTSGRLELRYPGAGYFILQLVGDQAAISMRNFEYKVLKQEKPLEPEKPEGEEKKDGEGKKEGDDGSGGEGADGDG